MGPVDGVQVNIGLVPYFTQQGKPPATDDYLAAIADTRPTLTNQNITALTKTSRIMRASDPSYEGPLISASTRCGIRLPAFGGQGGARWRSLLRGVRWRSAGAW